MASAPEIQESTSEERRAYIKERFPCIADCDMCGLCKVFRGKDAETAYADYINGNRSFAEVSADYK
ncbi:hypothetical protein SAMN02745229_00253 [Butyrivibrio fibrisolvens DSM 3071]|jgi:hypothetical protein|uniref:Uncharacterized protein n=1 Tax=Butyrivibrio fibrisolvens DSM 3071 TaxID=1121131 RepID=A0A1M5QAZ4_BUTFI|nr:hypothetical protein [Butyrivibrio fibrisolvens]SHH11148.1 hypothetical protein SAMN02745229_00253 [Butyrivibrio fibrisolvens DSM 3071]